MKKFITLLFLFGLVLNSFAQDTVYVYQDGGVIVIDGVEADKSYVNPAHISYKKIRDNYIIKDQLTKYTYNIGEYSDVFREDTIGFNTEDEFINYFNRIINRSVTDVYIQDQTTSPIELYLHNDDTPVTVDDSTTAGSKIIPLATGHGFTAGDFFYCDWFSQPLKRPRVFQAEVITVYTDSILIGVPFYETLDPSEIRKATRNNVNFAVNGAVTNVEYHVLPPPGITWDLTRVMITMILSGQPDDGLFGDLSRLTNGVYFGVEQSGFIGGYVGNFHDNSDFRASAYDVTYSVRSGGGGSWGMSVRKTFAGQDKYGVAIRLNGDLIEEFIGVVQDDLTGIVQFRVKVMGHIVEN